MITLPIRNLLNLIDNHRPGSEVCYPQLIDEYFWCVERTLRLGVLGPLREIFFSEL